MIVINEQQIRKAIYEALKERLDEGTNMSSLYHFTTSYNLAGILEDGHLKTSDGRNGARYISFTRHRSAAEGFAGTDEAYNVRIEVDGVGLSNLRNSKISPFEFYSPGRSRRKTGKTAKERYRLARLNPDVYSDNDTREFYNQAEESFETDARYIDIANIVKRIDIVMDETSYDHYDNNVGYCLDAVETGSPLLKLCYVYYDWYNFNYQTGKCIPLVKYAEMSRTAE